MANDIAIALIGAGGVIISGAVVKLIELMRLRTKEKKKQAAKEPNLDFNNLIRSKIQEVVIQIQSFTQAARVCVYEYHNGDATINGIPFNFVSMTYEQTDFSTKNIMMSVQRMPVSPYSKVLHEINIAENGYVKIDKDYPDEQAIRNQEYYDIDTSYTFKIGSSVWGGTLQIVWIKEEGYLPAESLKIVQQYIHQISDLMNQMIKHQK